MMRHCHLHYIWLDDEADMDAASAVSASGPAFVFYFIEAMAKAGEALIADLGL